MPAESEIVPRRTFRSSNVLKLSLPVSGAYLKEAISILIVVNGPTTTDKKKSRFLRLLFIFLFI
ncbi:hypothetical protein CEH05_20275 [Halobacillus halophilus]|nr:hypothetical protein CEH05_20275 [Halobacillus halophilus]